MERRRPASFDTRPIIVWRVFACESTKAPMAQRLVVISLWLQLSCAQNEDQPIGMVLELVAVLSCESFFFLCLLLVKGVFLLALEEQVLSCDDMMTNRGMVISARVVLIAFWLHACFPSKWETVLLFDYCLGFSWCCIKKMIIDSAARRRNERVRHQTC